MELLGLHLARPWYVRLRLLMWWNYPNTNGARFVSVEFVKIHGKNDPWGRGPVFEEDQEPRRR